MGLPEETANREMVKAFDPFDLTWRTALLYISTALVLTLLEAPLVYWVGAWLGLSLYLIQRALRRLAGLTYDLRKRVAALEAQLGNRRG